MKKLFFIIALALSFNLYGQTVVIEGLEDDYFPYQNNIKEYNPPPFSLFVFSQLDFVFNNFDEFKSILGEHNTKAMNSSIGSISLGLGGTYKNWLLELSFGFGTVYDSKNDSLNIEVNTSKFGIGFGYNLINSKNFIFTPKVSINWSGYRLLSGSKEEVDLEQYIHKQDLDIQLSHFTGFIGMNLSYKSFFTDSDAYWTLGLYGGYIFKIHNKPWVLSRLKELNNHNKIDIQNFTLGIRFSLNIELDQLTH